MIIKKLKLVIFIFLITVSFKTIAQDTLVIDKIVAVVGNNVILYSEIENQRLQYQSQGYNSKNMRCEIFEDLLYQKLLINQAAIDSVEVSEKEVDSELSRRMAYFINQIGSEEKLEEFYNKSIIEIKEDLKKVIEDQLITQRMQSEITGEIKITPSEVRKFFKNLPKDSLPYINAEMELEQIVLYPEIEKSEIDIIKEKLEKYKERVSNGETSFSTLAVLYSEDPGSSNNGGDLGYLGRGDLVEEFAAAAFNLDEGEISRIVKTDFGYHIIQMLEKKGEKIRCRHILLKPKVSPIKMIQAKNKLDSIKNLVLIDTLSFKQAVLKFSQDKNTRANGGLLYNPMTGSSKFEISEVDPATYYLVKDLEVGKISKPFEAVDDNAKQVYKIVKLKSKTKPHQANLKDDYQRIQEFALEKKQMDFVDEWVAKKIKTTYVKIDEDYEGCEFRFQGWNK
jgi:peptidyl-prolyl cis-trans isomerase SurA